MALPLPSCFQPKDPARFLQTSLNRERNCRPALSKAFNLASSFAKPKTLLAMSCMLSIGGEKRNCISAKDGVIIVDHGSRRQESNRMLNEFVSLFRDRTGYPIVEPAHMELGLPSIKDAFNSCVQKGAKRIIISPFFLFPGRHWHQDIPSLAAEAAKENPCILYIVTAPLGLHELLVDVVKDRIKYCLSHATGDADECLVCVGTGKCRFQWQPLPPRHEKRRGNGQNPIATRQFGY